MCEEAMPDPVRILIEKKESGEYMVMYQYSDDIYLVMVSVQTHEEARADAEMLSAEYDPALGILDTSSVISDVPRDVLVITPAGLKALQEEMRSAPKSPEELALMATLAQLEQLEVQLDELKHLERQCTTMMAKAKGFDLIAGTHGTFTIDDAALAIGLKATELSTWLDQNGWTYRRSHSRIAIGYQTKINAGLLVHKVTTVPRADGGENLVSQVRVTRRGLTKLFKTLGGRKAKIVDYH